MFGRYYDFNIVINQCIKYFSEIQTYKRTIVRKPPEIYIPRTIIRKKAQHQAHCIIANKAYNSMDDKRSILFLLNNILGGPGLNSRLNLGIREKYGFCYNLESNYTVYSDSGIVSIYLGTDFDYLEKTINLVLKELSKLRNNKLGTFQLHTAKQQIKGQIAISNDNNINELISMGKSIISYDSVESLESIYSKIEAITSEELIEVANEIFDNSQLTKLIYTKS